MVGSLKDLGDFQCSETKITFSVFFHLHYLMDCSSFYISSNEMRFKVKLIYCLFSGSPVKCCFPFSNLPWL